jgi:hypothetical protein
MVIEANDHRIRTDTALSLTEVAQSGLAMVHAFEKIKRLVPALNCLVAIGILDVGVGWRWNRLSRSVSLDRRTDR